MAGRRAYPWPTLTLFVALAVASTAQADPAANVLRLKPETDGKSNASISAEMIHSWREGDETVYFLAGNAKIEQDRTIISAKVAVVWVSRERPSQCTVYASEFGGTKARIETRGENSHDATAAIVEFTTPALGQIRGKEVKAPQRDAPVYLAAVAARGKPLPAPKVESNTDIEPPSAPPEAKSTPPMITPAQVLQPPGDPDAEPPLPKAISGPTVLPIPLAAQPTIWLTPRTNRPYNIAPVVTAKDRAAIVTGGIKVIAKFTTGSIKSLEMEADQVVVWQKSGNAMPAFNAMRTDEGDSGAKGIEVYLSGDVIVRIESSKDTVTKGILDETRTLRAERVYYDVDNHKAIAVSADLEYRRAKYPNTGHLVAQEIQLLSATELSAFQAVLHASRLPSDPGFTLNFDQADAYREPKTVRRTIFGTEFRNRMTGQVVEEEPDILEVTAMEAIVEGIPFFYLPSYRTNVKDPFGPFQEVRLRQSTMFGFQVLFTWDMLDLIGLTPLEGEKWRLMTDYLSARGPALGTNYTLNSPKFFGMEAPFSTLVKAYGIYDQGTDRIGSPRETAWVPPGFRGRFTFRHEQRFTLDAPEDLTLQSQVGLFTDRNFYEQYYMNEYHYGFNQETFVWLKYQTGNVAGTFLFEPDVGRDWINETFWLPRLDGYLLGQSLFERFTYHSWANIAYARFDPYRQPATEFPNKFDNGLPPIEVGVNTGRLDWMQKISAPFDAGPVRVVPYGVVDVAYYSQDNNGDQNARLYGGTGLKASVPLSKLYPDIESEMFNVQGIYHKNVFSVNYYIAGSSTSWATLPQLDRLNDEAVHNAWRDVVPWEYTYTFIPQSKANALSYGSQDIFNPRLYAIRRLVDSKPDELDDIQEVNVNWRQRLQTKRGYPGLEHTVDWLTLDLSATGFPVPNRDNFGSPIGFLEYALTWAAGDRTVFYSNGWFDPFEFGTRYWEVGMTIARDDRTYFGFSYKNVDPMQSRYVSISTTYIFSPKYAVTASTNYDLGYSSSLGASFFLTRVSTDLTVSIGLTYNTLINTFGFNLNIVPNLMATEESAGNIGQRGMGSQSGR